MQILKWQRVLALWLALVAFYVPLPRTFAATTAPAGCQTQAATLAPNEALEKVRKLTIDRPAKVMRLSTPAADKPQLATRGGEIGIIQLNAEDFAVKPMKVEVRDFKTGKTTTVERPAKPPDDLRALARAIEENKGGIVVMHEVVGQFGVDAKNNAQRFIDEYLDGKFIVANLATNDGFGNNTVMLVRKDLPFDIEYRSYRDQRLKEDAPPYTAGKKIFSRDMPVMILRERGKRKPALIVVGNHNKSKRLPDDPVRAARPDAGGDVLRGLQGDYGAAIHLALEKEFPGVPRMDAGDRNDDADKSPAYAGLRQVMSNAFDLLGIPPARRLTEFFYDDQHRRVDTALDSIFVNEAAKRPGLILGITIGDYKGPDGQILVPPDTQTEEAPRILPSDHRPVVLRVDLGKLLTEGN